MAVIACCQYLLPFWTEPYLEGWDHLGQIFKARMISESFFPDFHGWNPYFFLGSVEGVHYPPFFHWLTALLAQGMRLETAYRLLVSFGVLACWPAVYIFLRRHSYQRECAALGATAFVACQCLSENAAGANHYSTLLVGNTAEAFSLPLLFLFGAAIPDAIQRGRSWRASLLLALLTVTHIVTGTVAVVLLGGFLLQQLSTGAVKNAVIMLGRSLILSAFWLLPFLLYNDGSRIHPTGVLQLNWLEIALLTLSISLFIQKAWQRAKWPGSALACTISLLLAALLLNSLAGHPVPLHYPRFRFFLTTLSLLSLAGILNELDSSLRGRLSLVMHFCTAAIISIYGVRLPSVTGLPPAPASMPEIEGRILSLSVPAPATPRHQALYYPASVLRLQTLKGLFLEGSPLAEQVIRLEELVQRNLKTGRVDYWAGINPGRASRRQVISRARLRRILSDFQITHLLLNTPRSVALAASGTSITLPGQQRLYPVNQTALASVLPYRPGYFSDRLFSQLSRHRLRAPARGRLFVNGIVHFSPPAVGEVRVISHSPAWDSIRFQTDSISDVPVLIRVAWAPGWQANRDGTPIQIHKASPGTMLVSTHGEFQLTFQRTTLEKASVLISILGLIVLTTHAVFHWLQN